VSRASHTWRCSGCPATAPNLDYGDRRPRLPRGWHGDPVLCSTCNAERLRRIGSALRPGGWPRPLPSLDELRVRRARVQPPIPEPVAARPRRRRVGPAPGELAEAELHRDPERTDVAVAEAAGCSRAAAASARDRLEAAGAIPVVEYVRDARGRRIPLRRNRGTVVA
jgi:hypothetical protein